MLSFVTRTETYFQLCQESLLLGLQHPSLWLVLLWIIVLQKYNFMYSFLQVKRIQFFWCIMESSTVRLGLHYTNDEITASFCSHWRAKQSWRSPWKGLWSFLPHCLLYHSSLLYINITERCVHLTSVGIAQGMTVWVQNFWGLCLVILFRAILHFGHSLQSNTMVITFFSFSRFNKAE